MAGLHVDRWIYCAWQSVLRAAISLVFSMYFGLDQIKLIMDNVGEPVGAARYVGFSCLVVLLSIGGGCEVCGVNNYYYIYFMAFDLYG